MARIIPVFLKARGSVVTVISEDNYNFGGGDILHPIDFIDDMTDVPADETIYTCVIHDDEYRDIKAVAEKRNMSFRFEKPDFKVIIPK